MSAEIIAVGPYNSKITHHLEYMREDYEKKEFPAVYTVLTSILICTSELEGRELAKTLGFDKWDVPKHNFGKEELYINSHNLRRWAKDYEQEDAMAAIFDLAEHGFTFFYCPNG